jgi:putative ABC transport system permease protein
MMFGLFFKISIRNMRRHWRQSLSALLSVATGFVALVVFEGYMKDVKVGFYDDFRTRQMYGDFIIEKDGVFSTAGRAHPENFELNREDQKFISEILDPDPQVEAWMGSLRISGMVTNGRISTAFFGVGYDLKKGLIFRGQRWSPNTIYGMRLEDAGNHSIVLGKGLGENLDCVGDPPVTIVRSSDGYPQGIRPLKCIDKSILLSTWTSTGQISALDANVSGVVDAGIKAVDSSFIAMSLSEAQSLAHSESLSYATVLLKDGVPVKDFVDKFQRAIQQRGLNLHAVEWKDHEKVGDIYRRLMSMLTILRNFIVLIILCIGTLSVFNTLFKIIKGRSREIGTWRSLGFTVNQLTCAFAIEAFVLGLTGSALGLVLSILFTLTVNQGHFIYHASVFSAEPLYLALVMDPQACVRSFAILSAVCVFASMASIRGVVRNKIVDNLIAN